MNEEQIVVNWSDAPEWANSVVSDIQGSYFWIEKYGTNSKRQQFGLNWPESVTADTSGNSSNWTLVEERPA